MPAPVKALPQPPASQDDASARAGFSQNLARLNAKPLWERTMSMGPGSAAIPAIWRYRAPCSRKPASSPTSLD